MTTPADMQLLVSVMNPEEAEAALIGGAAIIDAKDPAAGALAPVTLDVFRSIHAVVGGIRPVSAALGDAADPAAIESKARDFAAAGAAFVKVGFTGVESPSRVRSLIAAAVNGVSTRAGNRHVGVVAVAYADCAAGSITPFALIDAASRGGATGVLIDTADKQGPGLPALMTTARLASWVRSAHGAALTAAVAGKLSLEDIKWGHECGADIVGVRGAACEMGRTSRVVTEKVRRLRAAATLTPA